MKNIRHNKIWGYEDWLYDDGYILIKYIKTHARLSIQVHPNEEHAKILGGKPKTEMWYMLKDSIIFVGFKSHVTVNDIKMALIANNFEDLMVKIHAKKHDCFFIPSGLVHAIGESSEILEVQQSSDTTYRLYDWNRTDIFGNKRQLHINEALKCIDLTLNPPIAQSYIQSKYFNVKPIGHTIYINNNNLNKQLCYNALLNKLTNI